MITEFFVNVAMFFVNIVISILPQDFVIPNWASHVLYFLKQITHFIPPNCFTAIFSTLSMWLVAFVSYHIVARVVELVANSIPGVNVRIARAKGLSDD